MCLTYGLMCTTTARAIDHNNTVRNVHAHIMSFKFHGWARASPYMRCVSHARVLWQYFVGVPRAAPRFDSSAPCWNCNPQNYALLGDWTSPWSGWLIPKVRLGMQLNVPTANRRLHIHTNQGIRKNEWSTTVPKQTPNRRNGLRQFKRILVKTD